MGKDLRRKVLTTYVLAKASDGYEVMFTLGEIDADFGNESILVATNATETARGESGAFPAGLPERQRGRALGRMLETIEVVGLRK